MATVGLSSARSRSFRQWDNLRDEEFVGHTDVVLDRVARERSDDLSPAGGVQRILPSEQDPDRLLELLWEGLSERYLGHVAVGLSDGCQDRPADLTKGDDLRDLLPPIVRGQLEDPCRTGAARISSDWHAYEAYETKADRFAWSAPLSRSGGAIREFHPRAGARLGPGLWISSQPRKGWDQPRWPQPRDGQWLRGCDLSALASEFLRHQEKRYRHGRGRKQPEPDLPIRGNLSRDVESGA